jgi:chromosome segregation protein
MYLKSIEISGFKSFAKKNAFSFNTPISAIVGPNGSGKSNVAESFRFVLGEQSIKSMRGKRGEDLIWNGSHSEPRGNRASVKAVFDNEKRIFDMDFQEVTVERVVHRDGLNEYFINGSPVRLKDVIELLAKAHIGSTGHHIISQGEADKIISATPKERKAMVEDALGLKIYQYKRAESERKLEKTFENIGQVESLRKEIAPHLRFLKKQVEKLEKTESLREELLATAKEYFKREETYLTEAKRAAEAERQPLEAQIATLQAELAQAKETLAAAGQKEKKEYLILELEKALHAARLEKDGFAREVGKLEGQVEAQEGIIRREEEAARSDEHKTVPLKEVEALCKEIEAEREDAGLFARIKARLAEFIKSRRENAHAPLVAEAKKALEELAKRKGETEAKLKEASEKEAQLQGDYENLKREVERAKDSDNSAQIAVFRIMSEENELRAKLNMVTLREEALKLEEASYKKDLTELAHLVGSELLKYPDMLTPGVDREERSAQLERKRLVEKLRLRYEDASVAGGEEMLKEYQETSERDAFLERELADLHKSAETLKELIKDLETRLATEFETGLKNINKEFEKLFAKMFDGGEAALNLVAEKGQTLSTDSQGLTLGSDEAEEGKKVEEGLDIKVNLPRKKVKSLMMLSGGERALTSIALIFAISAVNPPPFIILDETDAALDEANSKKYGDMIEHLAQYSQLIIITHNRETMSRAGVIYGVTMGSNGISKVLSISFDEASEVAK